MSKGSVLVLRNIQTGHEIKTNLPNVSFESLKESIGQIMSGRAAYFWIDGKVEPGHTTYLHGELLKNSYVEIFSASDLE